MFTTEVPVRTILTRTGGYLLGICSHSLQPYRGCPLGASLCGVGCYVQHAGHLTRGRRWGSFLEVRPNAGAAYLAGYDRERRWARTHRGRLGIFLSSATEPFPPQEKRHGATRSVLRAMLERPPDLLVVQTHSHHVLLAADLLPTLAAVCEVRVHISIETDRDRLPGLPPPASPVDQRIEAAARLRDLGLRVVITVAPLLPIADPPGFFRRLATVADAVVLDHFVGGDGSATGHRTRRTPLPAAMAAVEPASTDYGYLARMAAIATESFPGAVGIGRAGFAGEFNEYPTPTGDPVGARPVVPKF